MSSISIHCSHLWRGVSSPGSISMAEAAVRGQRPGVTRLRIIASPHSLLLKRLLEPCDLIMMWFLLFFFSLSSHHRWKQTCLTDTVNFIDLLGVYFFFQDYVPVYLHRWVLVAFISDYVAQQVWLSGASDHAAVTTSPPAVQSAGLLSPLSPWR